MEARRLTAIDTFAARTRALLMRDEARHNLMLGMTTTLTIRPDAYPEFHAWILEDGGREIGAGLITPPFNLVVSQPLDDGALEVLAEAVHRDLGAIPGVTGALPEAEVFADAWGRLTATQRRIHMAQFIYRLTAVRQAAPAPGRLRRAQTADRELVVDWVRAFAEEVDESVRPDVEAQVARRLSETEDGYCLWEDGAAVCLVGCGSRTPNGVRIGPVYTLPDLRRRGYARTAVAELSATLIRHGRTFCFLYTDAATPTANHIYQEIGYEQVCESIVFEFSG